MNDLRLGRLMRALRRRRGMRQRDLAALAHVSQSVVSRAERGHLDTLAVRVVRRVLAALDARVELDVSWRGGDADRLIDALHAELGVVVATNLVELGWQVLSEVTFMRLGERGSIDLVGLNDARRAAVITELKSEFTSYEQTHRRLDAKARVAASVIQERVGWRPEHLAVLLVLIDSRTNRDRVARVAPLLRSALPAGNVEVRRWLKEPRGNVNGIWFVRVSRGRTTNRRLGGPHRVRRPPTAGA